MNSEGSGLPVPGRLDPGSSEYDERFARRWGVSAVNTVLDEHAEAIRRMAKDPAHYAAWLEEKVQNTVALVAEYERVCRENEALKARYVAMSEWGNAKANEAERLQHDLDVYVRDFALLQARNVALREALQSIADGRSDDPQYDALRALGEQGK